MVSCSCLYSQDPDGYRAVPQTEAGFFVGPQADSLVLLARAMRDRVLSLLRDDHLFEQAERLLLPGYAGYPDEEDFPYISRVLGHAFEVVQPGSSMAPLVYGSGPVALRVARVLQADGQGHRSWHYVVEQAWRSSPRRR